jgi:hypothetical protein
VPTRLTRLALRALGVGVSISLWACVGVAETAQSGGVAGIVDNTGLAAHYTFDEGSGTVVKDHSGHQNDGRIHGAVFVKSPRGHALRFDGEDDYVNLGRSDSLEVTGDLTIEAWVKTDFRQLPQKHRLIVGSSAGLTVQRNYNLRIDHHNQLRLEWGDGQEWGALEHDPSFLDGSWRHLALVAESPQHGYLFVDGRLVAHQPVDVPIQKTGTGDVHLGGWGHGFFQGDLDEVRIYNRALSSREIRLDAGRDLADQEPTIELEAGYSYHQKSFLCDFFWDSAIEQGSSVEIDVTKQGSPDEVAGRRLALGEPTRPGSGRWSLADVEIGWEGGPEGDYRVEASAVAADGRVLARASAEVPYTRPPSWLGSKTGITDGVLPPYEPCRVEMKGELRRVGVWGRRYTFGLSPLLSSIESAGAELLAGPVRFDCVADGKRVSFAHAAAELTKNSPAEVVLDQSLQGPKTRLSIQSQVEYDGFIKVDWAVEADEALQLDRLTMEIPLRPEHATLLHSWPQIHSGEWHDGWDSRFQPILWIGNEERGLSWVAESDRNWSLTDREKAIELIRGDDEVTLRFNLVTKKVSLEKGQKLDYTFGLQATPVRPMLKSCWDIRLQRQPPYAHEYEWLTKKIDGKPCLEFYRQQGARALLALRWWDAFSYTLPLGHEQEFPKLVEACHQHDLKVVPYAIGFLLSEAAPEFKHFHCDMLARPKRPYRIDRLPGMDPQMTYFACRQGAWQDFVVASTAQCMDEYDTDGVYLDTTVRPHACRNRLHGCGYVGPEGTVRSTYPVFATRELMKRLYTVVKSRKPDGIVDAHVYDCLHVPALAFATSYWNGEQLPRREFKPDALPLDRFRTEFMGHNIGVPADVLYYTMGDYEACAGMALLHDVPVRSENERDFAILTSIWRVREAFGCNEAEFIGYWKAGDLVTVEPQGCYASLWRHPTNGVLAAVSNLRREPVDVRVTFDRQKLGLGPQIAAEDARAGKPLHVDGESLSIALGPQDWTFVWIPLAK